MAKRDNRGNPIIRDRYIQIKSWELGSAAFLALSPNEVRIYLELRSRYNGRNNGQIQLSTRDAGAVCHKSNSTGARALERLKELGFIKVRRGHSYGFDQKRLCREYELTALDRKPAAKNNKLPSGTCEFMKLKATDIEKIDALLFQNRRSQKTKHSVTRDTDSITSGNRPGNIVKFRA